MRMASPKSDSVTLKEAQQAAAKDHKMPTDDNNPREPEDAVVSQAMAAISKYLMENSPVYQQLRELRAKGWTNPEGDHFFESQKRRADENCEEAVQEQFNDMMEDIAKEMQCRTRAFTIKSTKEPQRVLDLCMAPGTYLSKALDRNPTAHAVAFTLPPSQGGLAPAVGESETVKVHLVDVTMLAADMGLGPGEVPGSHPDAANLIHERHLDDGRHFDLVLCDGAIRRTHERAEYRFHREARRLLLTQLALGLEHLWPGGTMIVLLHKVERLNTVRLLQDFMRFANVVLFKPQSGHTKRSSFYMVASAIRSDSDEAVQAVQQWKREWKVATLGTDEEWRGDYSRAVGELDIERLLEEFGPTLVKLGQKVWRTQAEALGKASFMKK